MRHPNQCQFTDRRNGNHCQPARRPDHDLPRHLPRSVDRRSVIVERDQGHGQRDVRAESGLSAAVQAFQSVDSVIARVFFPTLALHASAVSNLLQYAGIASSEKTPSSQ